MAGVGRQLFVPLSVAVGLAMISSYVLSSTLVPVMSTWIIRSSHDERSGVFGRLKSAYAGYLGVVLRFRWPVVGAYAVASAVLLIVLFPLIGTEVFPAIDVPHLQLRMRAPTGTRGEAP